MRILKYNDIQDANEFLQSLKTDSIIESVFSIEIKFLNNLPIHKRILSEYSEILSKLNILSKSLIKTDEETLKLLVVSALTVCILEEDNKYSDITFKKEIKSILEELKLKGIGNGIVKKLSGVFNHIIKISNKISKHDNIKQSLLHKNIIDSVASYISKHGITLNNFASKFNTLELSIQNKIVSPINEHLNNKTLINIDIQPEYKKWITFDIIEWTNMVNKHTGTIVFLYNGRDMGYGSESEYIQWLFEIGIDENIIDSSIFFEKSYGFFRYMMGNVDDQAIVNLVKFMIKHKLNDSRDLVYLDINHNTKFWDEFIDEYGDYEVRELMEITDDSIYVPELVDFLKNYNNIIICGGGRNECLKEVEIALQAIDKPYDTYEEFVY